MRLAYGSESSFVSSASLTRYSWNWPWDILSCLKERLSRTSFSSSCLGRALDSSSIRSLRSLLATLKSMVFSSSIVLRSFVRLSNMMSSMLFCFASFSIWDQCLVKASLPSLWRRVFLSRSLRSSEYILSSSFSRVFRTASVFFMETSFFSNTLLKASRFCWYRVFSSTPYSFMSFSETMEKNSPADILPLRMRYSAVSLRILGSGKVRRRDMSIGPSAPSNAIKFKS